MNFGKILYFQICEEIKNKKDHKREWSAIFAINLTFCLMTSITDFKPERIFSLRLDIAINLESLLNGFV